jgi:DNA end-binding protein Ku
MAARALGSATISFGLVSIPVKLFTTSESSGQLHFNWLHSCGSRVKQQYWCVKEDKPAPRDELVKGYEFSKGQYVTFTPDELRALDEIGNETIEIHEFLPLAGIDPIYFEKAYYLGPDKGGAKPYKLLAEAMQRTGRAAIASWAARGKQYLVVIRPFRDGLVLEQLRYADELKSFDEVDRGDATVKGPEVDLAVQLVEQISSDAFRPEQYHDTVRERVEAAIRRKVEGEEAISVEAPAAPEAQIIDLMDALRASLEGRGAAGRKGPKRAERAAAAREAAGSDDEAGAAAPPARARVAKARPRNGAKSARRK